MNPRVVAPTKRDRKKKKESTELVFSQGWIRFLFPGEQTRTSIQESEHENKLSFRHSYTAENRLESCVVKVDETGLEKQSIQREKKQKKHQSWEVFIVCFCSPPSPECCHHTFCLNIWSTVCVCWRLVRRGTPGYTSATGKDGFLSRSRGLVDVLLTERTKTREYRPNTSQPYNPHKHTQETELSCWTAL